MMKKHEYLLNKITWKVESQKRIFVRYREVPDGNSARRSMNFLHMV